MKYLLIPTMLMGLALFGRAPAGRAQGKAKPDLAEQVKKSIDRGIGYMRQAQRNNGGWELEILSAAAPGGCTALSVLALLYAGVPLDDPMMVRGMKFVRQLKPEQTYVRALQTMVLAQAGQVEDRERIAANTKWLIEARDFRNKQFTGWSYKKTNFQAGDGSNSQYAVLGLQAAREAGIPIDTAVWKSILDLYVRDQDRDGGFVYNAGLKNTTQSMTTAGLCGLIIAGMELNAGRELLQNDGTAKNCGAYRNDQPVNRALNWLIDRGLRVDAPPVFYNLYGIERVGRLSGLRFIGRYDWYREGCKYLVDKQRDDGSWQGNQVDWDRYSIVSTSFALLFLSKGRTPVLISKLVHSDSDAWPRPADDTDWNNDRNDLRNLTAYASKELFHRTPLAWQIFDLRQAAGDTPAEDDLAEITSDLLQSPMVYFNGHRSPLRRFREVEKTLLKRYIENGGFVLAEACCGSADFDEGFKRLAAELWPDNPLENLSPQHPIWRAKFAVNPGEPYHLMGIQMGCKTVLVYSPEDLSCQWESAKPDTGRGEAAFRLGANIVAYATGLEPPKPRLTHVEVAAEREEKRRSPRGYFRVGQVKFNGDYKPAPRAMRNLMAYMHKFAGMDVILKTEEVRIFDPSIKDFKFLYLHGRGKFNFGAEELENLRFNLDNGAVLLADACCGQETFDESFRKFVQQLFPNRKLERVPLDDVVFSKDLNGTPLTDANVKCRQEKNHMPRNMAPWLEGIKIDGRWAVLYSKYDLGCALERHQSSDCVGYTPESALLLARAAVLYTLRP